MSGRRPAPGDPPPIVFLHGLESGPHGRKYQALQAAFGGVEAPDCTGVLDVEDRLRRVEAATRGRTGLVVVGSSFGGLVAALLADRHPERVGAYLLAAPALHLLPDPGAIRRVPPRAQVIHGVRDAVVPLAASEAFCRRFGIALDRVDDDHRLAASLDRILRHVEALRRAVAAG